MDDKVYDEICTYFCYDAYPDHIKIIKDFENRKNEKHKLRRSTSKRFKIFDGLLNNGSAPVLRECHCQSIFRL